MVEEEVFKEIPKYDDYLISNFGRVYSKKTNKFIKFWANNKGYCTVALCQSGKKKNYLVHRLIAEVFIPNPNNLPMINHKDENPLNNNISNLEWCTAKYNCNYGTGLEKRKQTQSKKVLCIETNIIYPNVIEAYNDTKANCTSIHKVCHNQRKTAGKLHWKYVEEEK